ncbi:hypothetical protein M5W83_02135 [Paenibacillus thiaminolyticus]|uniref:Uncharacterized protein n=1 Tax=Paenibacillus thiaminolyticus TaxID=49283 RepID=A0AAP9DW89_PANTH|nr:hypothetical protein [Paenibacillus thiaminolyticus]MCY9538185.1 hypothetical protein [Paenibacillus thiaminolyticus]MCY9602163.1 hypothetical protein [Paenibacillus thiaminolyticus]MCY9605977.1 hypothetical protein [Paenibacillus thiaminolyticus]MCY9612384.1 hypothetical protein [Paenibacillus thiaminolyticus]MCY9621173.1 hypothetical protein [Paenibacillus thiaminolyticus]
MPVPATTGQLRKHVKDMRIGDYIVWSYHNDDYFEFGADTSRYTECPLEGIPNGETTKGKYWYGIKVDQGLLISDRVLRNQWSWDYLNSLKYIEGVSTTISTVKGILRSLTGGVAYADANGNKSLTDQGNGGWPTNNEWDKYIVNFPSSKIQQDHTKNDVFHWNEKITICQETPALGVITYDGFNTTDSKKRVRRGYKTIQALYHIAADSASEFNGFRPVFEYQE